ncbi:MAG: diacylglycerol/lipid kinase family protein [Bacteroidia bacterium]
MFVADGLRKKIAFIINPNAGVSNTETIIKQIKEHTPNYVDYEIILWDAPAQGKEITDRVLKEHFSVAVAVGGDGTVNEVSKALVGTEVALAIIPIGSGNGLARHLKIPLDVKNAIHVILHGEAIKMDSCFINDKAFFCTSGIGFDAHIGKLFAEAKTRGFSTYVRITISQLLSYRAVSYSLRMNKEEIKRKAFLITFANASQYGNDAFIAPHASVGDGLIDVCILKPFKFWDLPGIVWKMFHKTIDHSHFMETYRASEIEVEREGKGPAHFDGEPDEMGARLRIHIQPSSLSVITPA